MTDQEFDKLWQSPSAQLTPEDEVELQRMIVAQEAAEANCPNRQNHMPHLVGDDGCPHCGFYGQ
jgi:hypothetical protein